MPSKTLDPPYDVVLPPSTARAFSFPSPATATLPAATAPPVAWPSRASMSQLSEIFVLIWFSMFRNCLLRRFSIERLTWSGWRRLLPIRFLLLNPLCSVFCLFFLFSGTKRKGTNFNFVFLFFCFPYEFS